MKVGGLVVDGGKACAANAACRAAAIAAGKLAVGAVVGKRELEGNENANKSTKRYRMRSLCSME